MQINGNTIALEQHGEGDALLMIHGLGGTSNTWFAQRRVLARSFRVLCVDLNGSGRSSLDGPLSIERFVDDMVSLLDATEIESAHLVGHSMGTIVCQHLAVSHASRVKSMVLLGPLTEPPETARAALAERATLARSQGMEPIADSLLTTSTSEHTRAHQPAVCAMVRETLMRQSGESYACTCEALAAAESAALERVRCPTLLITGDEDPVGPPAKTQDMAQRIPGAQMLVLEGTGHWAPLERPQAVNQSMLNFYFAARALDC